MIGIDERLRCVEVRLAVKLEPVGETRVGNPIRAMPRQREGEQTARTHESTMRVLHRSLRGATNPVRDFRQLQAEVMRLLSSAESQPVRRAGLVQSSRLRRAPDTFANASKSRRFRVTRGSCLATAMAAISRSPKLCRALRAEPAHIVAARSAVMSSTGRTTQA